MELLTGEKFQEIANIFIGSSFDFDWNPRIKIQIHKLKDIDKLNHFYDNPKILFCYSHNIYILQSKIKFFLNSFVLITHNSDQNILNNDSQIKLILNEPKLIKWYAQNINFQHPKLHFLPIGIANEQWNHGMDFKNFYNNLNINNIIKTKNIYFNFKLITNKQEREKCYNSLKNKIEFLSQINNMDNLKRMSEYKFCICPVGNGFDTHRFWEALYLKCVPIVINDDFINVIKNNTNLPLFIINSWDELDINNLPDYNSFNFDDSKKYLDFNYYKNLIENTS